MTMARVYVGNLDSRVTEGEIEYEFVKYGVLRSVWVARKPAGYAFIVFDNHKDALDAIHGLDGKNGWRVELSYLSKEGGGLRVREDFKCYACGKPGHFARECHTHIGSRGLGSGRNRSPSPRGRWIPNSGRSPRGRRSPRCRSITPLRGRSYSRSPPHHRPHCDSPDGNGPRGRRSPRRRSITPRRGCSYSRSPPHHRSHRDSPDGNGD